MPEATPLLYTGMPRTWAIASGLPAVRHSVRLAIARAAWAHCLIVVSRVNGNSAGWGGAPEASPGHAPMQTPAREIADGRSAQSGAYLMYVAAMPRPSMSPTPPLTRIDRKSVV